MEQKQNIVLGPRYAVRVSDLRPWVVVEVRCGACGHTGLIEARAIQAFVPEYERLMDIRFRCSKCGNRERNTWQTLRLPRNW